MTDDTNTDDFNPEQFIEQQFRDTIEATLDDDETTSAVFMAITDETSEVIGTDKYQHGLGTDQLSRNALKDQLLMLNHHVGMLAEITDTSRRKVLTSLALAELSSPGEQVTESFSMHADPTRKQERD